MYADHFPLIQIRSDTGSLNNTAVNFSYDRKTSWNFGNLSADPSATEFLSTENPPENMRRAALAAVFRPP